MNELFIKGDSLTTLNQLLESIRPKQNEISQASTSHNYLRQLLNSISSNGVIPPIDTEFLTGSYIRGTKITPLDDVDLFLVLSPDGLSHYPTGFITRNSTTVYRNFLDQNGYVSSIKILNALQSGLSTKYQTINRENQALNIFLTSYGIGIDIVPSFKLENQNYLIPYGHGKNHWLITNPQKDQEIVEQINNQTNKVFKDIIRIIKYWNKKKNYNRLSSYHIEAIGMNIFRYRNDISSYLVGLMLFFNEAKNYTYNCPDPTGIGDPITSYLEYRQISL
ncbi:MAG: nucleotidyltransferase, partial [Methanobacteriota archaeon]